MVSHTIFLVVGIVGMGGAEETSHVLIVLRMLVGVAHQKANRCAGGLPLKDTAEQLHTVGLLPRGGDVALSRTAAVELMLDEFHIDIDASGHAVDHTAHPWAMALAESGQPEDVAEGIAHLNTLHILHNRFPVRSHRS